MKFIIASDLHFHKYRAFNQNNRRLHKLVQVVDELFVTANEHGANILIPGDLLNNMQTVHVEAMEAVTDIFTRMTSKYPDIFVFIISGNHDYATKNLYDRPAVSAISTIARLSDKILHIDNTYWNCGDSCIYGLPYYEYREDLDKALDDLVEQASERDGKSILLMHQTIGFGHDLVPDDIDPDDPRLKKFDMVFNGHIHKHQKIRDGFYNVGSPIHRDAGDVGQDKGFLLYDTDMTEVDRIILDDYPKFRKLPAGEDIPEGWERDYIIEIPADIEVSVEEEQVQKMFDHNKVTREELLENYLSLKKPPEGLDMKKVTAYGHKLLSYAD